MGALGIPAYAPPQKHSGQERPRTAEEGGPGEERIGHAWSRSQAGGTQGARACVAGRTEGRALAPPEGVLASRRRDPGWKAGYQLWSNLGRIPPRTTSWTPSWKSSRASLTVAAFMRTSGRRWAVLGSPHMCRGVGHGLVGHPGFGAPPSIPDLWRCQPMAGF